MRGSVLSMLLAYGCFCVAPALSQNKEAIALNAAKFITGDDKQWSRPDFNDGDWKTIETGKVWQEQGYPNYHGYAWYRIHVVIPSTLKNKSVWKDSLRIFLAHVNDVDDTWLNGIKIGHTGGFPEDPGGYSSKWPAVRAYQLAAGDAAIHWDKENVIAIRVYDGGGTGGIFMGHPYIDMLERMDGMQVDVSGNDMQYGPNNNVLLPVMVKNRFKTTIAAVFEYTVYDILQKKSLAQKRFPLSLNPFQIFRLPVQVPGREGISFSCTLTELSTSSQLKRALAVPYLLTPAEGSYPKINGPSVTGIHPGSPFLYKIPATGRPPLVYAAANLPGGLVLDKEKGIISGTLAVKGDYPIAISVTNALGKAEKRLLVRAGDVKALTPAMGWNSWNCWGLSVSDEKVRSSAQALVDKGLASHGWTYINIDDGWEAAHRNAEGSIVANEKFPDMQQLAGWLHAQGLKFGIYSSPGATTCGGYLGSYGYEEKDAVTYSRWGIDYLKYDWCSYSDIVPDADTVRDNYIKPYRLMQLQLQRQPRDIYYSLCQYGMKQVEQWGPLVDAQSWRTTEDIEDSWQSLRQIGFSQAPLYKYAGPGRWNDPDMLIVGMVGWGENLHPTRLTPYEQYTHISLWSLLSAPLLIGCDISKLDRFTLNLLTNDEVIAIDQDALGRQAQRRIENDSCQVWIKELQDGSNAVGIFNMSDSCRVLSVAWKDIGIGNSQQVRDVWRQHEEGIVKGSYLIAIPPHGVKLLRVKQPVVH